MSKTQNQVKPSEIKLQIVNQPKRSLNLKQILELTQQNQTCRIQQNPLENNQQQYQESKSCFKRSIQCIQRIASLLTKKQKLAEVDINQSQMSKLIDKLRSKKTCTIILPPQKKNKKTLVLDLDQTLVHTTFKKPELYDLETEILIKGKNCVAYTIKRFGLDSFLFQMSQIYQIVVFTASQKKYADLILNKIDPKGWITHRLYRQHCIVVNKVYYLKNLKILGRSLNSLILVDDNRMSGILQPDNFYRIQPFIGNPKDRKLVRLCNFLKYLNDFSDIRSIANFKKKYQQRQIKLKQNVDSILNNSFLSDDKKKMYKHKKTNSEIEGLKEKDQNKVQSQNEHENTNTNLVIIK